MPSGNLLVVVPVFAVTFAVLLFLRRRVTEVIADERTYTVAGKAARATIQIASLGMVLAGIVLLAMRKSPSTPLGQTATTLLYVTCGLLLLNSLAFFYYNRKTGGA
ncbi:MAG: DUF2178 domain-containing protein [Dehalococcoidales bacterium]|nr:DUF2178 domain-containing protein [Dehalococcoidales bacterium]